ncbi:diguanylate cyclase [Clostridium magnum]|uniref:Cyclic di-GMP phosphodiesterase response regulator RpfG n=1 Tax=Clostridium magnum DSM 2767 TaxID=1121326 RepID=A0A162SYV8_9CLOT|nr:diguanylate cyclase [Clostridium magnum]KZL92041.1 cyclic di-GMP phosphodiesterase response regulator RpfG [Clostridium magnum DSM 2767]SHH24850.1 diguanylate cyclase (GGDEF) domain-containing protein/HDIG domain-containing protein [Clostridium magnum DSM 2767]
MLNKIELINYFQALIEKDEVTNTLLLALKHKYHCVYTHCLNVCLSSYLLSRKMNLSDEECINVALGGLLHDIGKLNISSKILYKPGPLDAKERSIIVRHPINGVNLLNSSRYLDKVHDSILYHHERYDGEGYCSKLKEEDIPLKARIISICDSFDAMISFRNYRNILTLQEGKDELIRNSNTQFDGSILNNFLEIIDDYYNQYYNSQNPSYIQNTKIDSNINTNWESILDKLPDIGVILIDKHDKIQFCNKFAASIRNKNIEDILGSSFTDFHRKHRNSIIKDKLLKVKLGEINGWERIMKRSNKYLENKYIAIHDEDNKYDGLLMLTRDVSEQEKMLRLLEKSIENLNILVQANSLLTEVYDLEEILIRASVVFNKIISVDHISIIIKRYMDDDYYNVNNIDGFTENIQEYINENLKEFFYTEDSSIELIKIDDKNLITSALHLENNNKALIFIQTDIETEVEEREKKLLQVISNYTNSAIQKYLFLMQIEEKAIKDNLTGIYNRQYLQRIIESLNPDLNSFAVIMIDINNLKYINDTFGHLYGDLLIKTTAQILKRSIRKNDYVFRYGGDEFIILALSCSEKDVKSIIRRINNNIIFIWNKREKDIKLTMSIGYSISSKGISINTIIKTADENMYIEKEKFHNYSKKHLKANTLYQNEKKDSSFSK